MIGAMAKTLAPIIYLLHHPESEHVYIGKSRNGLKRAAEHSFPSSLSAYAHLPRSKWIKSLYARGLAPHAVVLEECASVDDLSEAEQFHIAYFRSLGVKLLNCTDGGDGVVGHVPNAEARAKMSAKSKERVARNPDMMGAMARKYWSDPAAREKKRAERTGQHWDAETRAKMSAAHKGKPKSAEARAVMAVAAKLRWADPAYRAKQIAAQRAAKSTPETKAKAAEWGRLAKRKPKDPPA